MKIFTAAAFLAVLTAPWFGQATDLTINYWAIPANGGPLQSQIAVVGDVFTWEWSGVHSVYIHPTGTCDTTGNTEVGISSPASYTFQQADGSATGNVMYFACDVPSHCSFGMIMNVTVYSTAANLPSGAATGATTAAPAAGASTSAPVATTSAPVATTSAPVATTSAPVATTSAPGATTSAPGATTSAPGATTSAPGATTSAPGATTSAPGASTSAPGSSAPAPANSGAPASSMPAPTAKTPAPALATKGPAQAPKATSPTAPSTTAPIHTPTKPKSAAISMMATSAWASLLISGALHLLSYFAI